MEHNTKLRISVLILFTSISEVIGQCENREPNCYSRFDYEYKVLQRLIQLEDSQNGLKEKLAANENEKEELKREIKRLEESQRDLTGKLVENELEKDELKDELTRISELVSSLGDGRDTQQGSAVAFSAYIDATTSLSTDKTVFNRVLINEHQAYDQSTGVFTCPISGVYMFSFVAAARGATTTWAELRVRGAATLHAITEGTKSDQDLQGTNIAVVKLNKGDEVWVAGSGTLPANSNGDSNKRTSSFSGFLVQPTTD